MAKRFGPGTCIHCGEPSDKLTNDHIFPDGWYPDSTPRGLEKWQAPSCEACNAEYGKLERRLFQQLAMGVEPWVVGGEGIGERALRGCDPRAAKSDDDKKHREGAREKLRRRMKELPVIPLSTGILPNVGTIMPSVDGYTAEEIDWSDIERMVVKFVRGMTYHVTGQVLPQSYVIHVVRPELNGRVSPEITNSPATTLERGPGFRVVRHATAEDQFSAFFRIFLWGKYEFFAAVWSSELDSSRTIAG